MNLLNVISNEESIGGLEIADDSFRFSKLKKVKTGFKIELLIEEKITEKDAIVNEATFADKLSKFANKNNIKYVIVSVPADNIFVKTYDFPAAMSDEKIAEAMDLAIELQLPRKKEEIYCDWMEIENNESRKILLSYIDRGYADNLISKIKKAGIKIVAIESHALSLARTIKQKSNEAIILAEKGLKKNFLFCNKK